MVAHLGQLVKDWLVIWLTKNNEQKYIENYQINNNVFIFIKFSESWSKSSHVIKITFKQTTLSGGQNAEVGGLKRLWMIV